MPQGVLKKKSAAQAKRPAANKHGKGGITKKGRLEKPPKKGTALKQHKESVALTKAINAENEQHFAGVASNSGGRLAVLKAPVTATADEKQRMQQQKAAVGMKQASAADG